MRPFADNYAEELGLDEDHLRTEWSYEYPLARTSAGKLELLCISTTSINMCK